MVGINFQHYKYSTYQLLNSRFLISISFMTLTLAGLCRLVIGLSLDMWPPQSVTDKVAIPTAMSGIDEARGGRGQDKTQTKNTSGDVD